MRRAALIVIVIISVLLQVSFLPGLRPFGVVPNITLVVLVLASFSVVTSEALMLSAASGLVLDLVSGQNFGLWTGVFMLTTLVVGLMRRAGLELDAMIIGTILVSAATIVIAVVLWLTFIPSVARWPIGAAAGRLMLELVVNLSLMILLRAPIRWVLGGSRQERAELGV